MVGGVGVWLLNVRGIGKQKLAELLDVVVLSEVKDAPTMGGCSGAARSMSSLGC